MSFPSAEPDHWAYDLVLALDRYEPGLAGDVLRATPLRRQVLCAALSRVELATLSSEARIALARDLRFRRSKQLIADRLGALPAGLLACLRRLRQHYNRPSFYEGLYRLHANPAAAETIAFIERTKCWETPGVWTTLPAILHLQELGDAFIDPALLAMIGDAWDAPDLFGLVRFLRRFIPGIRDAAIVAALLDADPSVTIEHAAAPWLRRGRPDPLETLTAHGGFEPITSVRQLRNAAREFKNCLREHRYRRMIERASSRILIWRSAEPAVFTLARVGRLWRVRELAGIGNASLSPASHEALAATLEGCGILATRRDPFGLDPS